MVMTYIAMAWMGMAWIVMVYVDMAKRAPQISPRKRLTAECIESRNGYSRAPKISSSKRLDKGNI